MNSDKLHDARGGAPGRETRGAKKNEERGVWGD